MVEWSIAAFRAAPSVGPIVVACPPGHEHGLGADLKVVDGGAERAISVANALAAVETEIVAIHDAARPLLSADLIEGVVATLAADPGAAGAIAATPVTDTIKRAAAPGDRQPHAFDLHISQNALSCVAETVDRRVLWAAQTPQIFQVGALRSALQADPAEVAAATDEAMLVESAGGKVLIHPASPQNLKVTTPSDLKIAELLLAGDPGRLAS
jgi:2-C-methyl-D-erythritol 4-phosphate cytidylyltransferase